MSQPLPIRYTIEAEADLDKIWNDLKVARGTDFADQYMQELKTRIGTLDQHPRRYRLRPKFGKGRRLMPEDPYHVIYRVDLDKVLIVRVMHGSRNITRRTIDAPDQN